jgi:hypothetical protein
VVRGFWQPSYDAVVGDLPAQTLDLVVLSGKARDRQVSELGELRDLLVAGDDARFGLGILCLESFNLRDPGIDDLSGVAEFVQPAFELLGEVLVGPGPGGSVAVLLWIETGAGHAGQGGEGLQVGLAAGWGDLPSGSVPWRLGLRPRCGSWLPR